MVISKITFKHPLIKYSKIKNSNLTIVPHIGGQPSQFMVLGIYIESYTLIRKKKYGFS